MAKLKIFLAAFALTVFVSGACSEDAPPPDVQVLGVITPDKTEVFMQIAAEMSRYPLPASARPVVFILPSEEMGPLLGAFNCADPNVVLVNIDTPPDLRAGVIVHEFVHFLQCQAGQLPAAPTCEQRAAFEAEAYTAEYRFELKYLKVHRPLDVTTSNCENRGITE